MKKNDPRQFARTFWQVSGIGCLLICAALFQKPVFAAGVPPVIENFNYPRFTSGEDISGRYHFGGSAYHNFSAITGNSPYNATGADDNYLRDYLDSNHNITWNENATSSITNGTVEFDIKTDSTFWVDVDDSLGSRLFRVLFNISSGNIEIRNSDYNVVDAIALSTTDWYKIRCSWSASTLSAICLANKFGNATTTFDGFSLPSGAQPDHVLMGGFTGSATFLDNLMWSDNFYTPPITPPPDVIFPISIGEILPFAMDNLPVSCCENESCEIPFYALNAQSDGGLIAAYLPEFGQVCAAGNANGYFLPDLFYNWYKGPYDPSNLLIIPSTTLELVGVGTFDLCLAGEALGYDPLAGTTSRRSFEISGRHIVVYASTTGGCAFMPTQYNFRSINYCDGVEWTDFGSEITCSLKNFGVWLITPDAGLERQLKDNIAALKQAFPFSAFFGILSPISQTIATTTDSRDGSFSVPMFNGHSYYMIKIMSSSSMPNAIGQKNADLFRNSIIWFLWIAGAGYVLIRIIKK